jgi:hypothetical protein
MSSLVHLLVWRILVLCYLLCPPQARHFLSQVYVTSWSQLIALFKHQLEARQNVTTVKL